jgi:hypothetical protein
MPKITRQGNKSFSIEELINLAKIGTFGRDYQGAILGALAESKAMRVVVDKLHEENKRLQLELNEAVAAQYRTPAKKHSTKE